MKITISGDGKEGPRVVDWLKEAPRVVDRLDGQAGAKEPVRLMDGEVAGGIKCPHCKLCPTNPVDYKSHLESTVHAKAMKSCMLRLNLHLRNMRNTQRNQQREADRAIECEYKEFCKTCCIIYKQSKADHNKTEYHKMIKKFLMPKCNVCNMDFRCPLAYEKHIAEYSHIMKEKSGEGVEKVVEYEAVEVEPPEDGLDMENFMTFDEVGDVKIPKDGEEEKEPLKIDQEGIKKEEREKETNSKRNRGSSEEKERKRKKGEDKEEVK